MSMCLMGRCVPSIIAHVMHCLKQLFFIEHVISLTAYVNRYAFSVATLSCV